MNKKIFLILVIVLTFAQATYAAPLENTATEATSYIVGKDHAFPSDAKDLIFFGNRIKIIDSSAYPFSMIAIGQDINLYNYTTKSLAIGNKINLHNADHAVAMGTDVTIASRYAFL